MIQNDYMYVFFLHFQHLFMALPRLVFLVIALVVLTVLVGVFFCQHLYLVCTNQTTNERHKLQEFQYNQSNNALNNEQSDNISNTSRKRRDRKQGANELPASYRPYSRGILNNVLEVILPHNFIMSKIKQTWSVFEANVFPDSDIFYFA